MKITKQTVTRWKDLCKQIQQETSELAFESKEDKLARIEKAKSNYAFFVEYYFPHYAKAKCASFQIAAANEVAANSKIRAVFEWARGHAKSTHFDIMIPLWLKIKGELNVMVLVGKSEDNAAILLGDLQAELQYNQRYISDYGEQINQGSWEEGKFATTDDKAFYALGRGQSPRGLRYKTNRPDYIVIDDIDDDEIVHNEHRVAKMVDWILEALLNTTDMGRGRFILIGNRIHKNSILANVVQQPGFHHTVVNAIDENGKPTWHEKYSAKEIHDLIETMGLRRAQKEYFNNPVTDGSVFKLKDIQYIKPLAFKQYNYLVSYTDPSFKNGTRSDYKATVLLGKTREGHYHILKAFVQQTSVKQMVNWHYDLHTLVGEQAVISFYMESNFLQDLLFEEFIKHGNEVGWQLPIKGDTRNKPDKFQRVENIQPLFERGLIFFSEDEKNSPGVVKLVEQLLLFEKGARTHDDGPDALEGAIWMLNYKTRVSQPMIIGKRGVGNFRNKRKF